MTRPTRFLLWALPVIAALTAASAVGVLWHARHVASMQTLSRLKTAANIENAMQDQRLLVLRLRADSLALDPAFVDYVAQSLIPDPSRGNAIDSASITDLLIARRHGYDLAVVLDPQGASIARSGTPLARHERIQRDPLVIKAMHTLQPTQGTWVDNGQVVLVVVEPLLRGGALQGFLLAAERVDNHFADAVSRVAHAGFVLFASPKPGVETVTSAGLEPWITQALATHTRQPQDAPNSAGRSLRLIDDGHTTLAWETPLVAASGHATMVVVAPDLDPMRSALTAAWPLLLGTAVLGLIAALAALLYWRRVGIPLQHMLETVERGQHGDRQLVIRVDGTPSVRRLRDAINRLLAQDQASH